MEVHVSSFQRYRYTINIHVLALTHMKLGGLIPRPSDRTAIESLGTRLVAAMHTQWGEGTFRALSKCHNLLEARAYTKQNYTSIVVFHNTLLLCNLRAYEYTTIREICS